MKLSIITVNLNNRQGMLDTIRSVEAQSVKDFEWIVVDGGSTDGSRELIEDHQASFSCWVSEPDKGIYNAMNKGIKMSSGEYLLFLNSGDLFHDERVVESIIPSLYGSDFIAGDALLVDEKNQCVGKKEAPDVISKFYLMEMSLCHQSTFIKSILLKERPYNEALKIVSDWEQFFFQLIVNGRTYRRVPLIVADYLIGGISETNKYSLLNERKAIINHYFTQRQQDEIYLAHFFSKHDESSYNKITAIAYIALSNRYYTCQEYHEIFHGYLKIIMHHGLWYQRILIWMSLNGFMRVALFFVRINGRKTFNEDYG